MATIDNWISLSYCKGWVAGVNMSVIVNYFKKECRLYMVGLEHSKPSEFYISVWQTTRSPFPLLVFRTLLFLTSLAIVITSISFYISSTISVGYWFIYLTHWGLTLMTLSTGFGAAISAKRYFSGPLSTEFSLPWYVKTFWVLHNVSVPLAFLITIFYWAILYSEDFLEEINAALDIAIHGVNSIIMFLHLVSSSHPTRFLHLVHPFAFALTYVFFSIIYYLAGGKNPLGQPWVYPVVNWEQPGSTIVVIIITGILLILLHFVTIGFAAARDSIANRLNRPSETVHIEEGIPLRTNIPQQTNID